MSSCFTQGNQVCKIHCILCTWFASTKDSGSVDLSKIDTVSAMVRLLRYADAAKRVLLNTAMC